MALPEGTHQAATRRPGRLAGLLDELRWRACSTRPACGLAERLATGTPIKVQNGFDPTGPRSQSALGRSSGYPSTSGPGDAIVARGRRTAMIGDPSGRSSERLLLSDTVEENIVGIQTS